MGKASTSTEARPQVAVKLAGGPSANPDKPDRIDTSKKRRPETASGIGATDELLADLNGEDAILPLQLSVQDDPVPGEQEIIGNQEMSVRLDRGQLVEGWLNGVPADQAQFAAAADARRARLKQVLDLRVASRKAKWAELGRRFGLEKQLAKATTDGPLTTTIHLRRDDAKRMLHGQAQDVLAGASRYHAPKPQIDLALSSLELSTIAHPAEYTGNGLGIHVHENQYPFTSGSRADCLNMGNLEVIYRTEFPSWFKTFRTGVCVDVSGGSSANGSAIQIWECNEPPRQNWFWKEDGTIRIFGKCLDVRNGDTANGTVLQLWDCNGSGAQVWETVEVPNVGTQAIRNPQSGRCIDLPNNSQTWGTQLQIFDCNGSDAQLWWYPQHHNAHPTMMIGLAQKASPAAKIVYTTDAHPSEILNHNPPVYVTSMSAVGAESGTYDGGDREYDISVRTTRMAHFNSAGNGLGNVHSPALAYNGTTIINYDARVTPPTVCPSRTRDGTNPETIKPEFATPGEGIRISPTYQNAGGTSSAAPLAAGFANDLLQKHAFLRGNPALLKAVMMTSAERLNTDGPYSFYGTLVGDADGFGRPDWSNLSFGTPTFYSWDTTDAQLFNEDQDGNGRPERNYYATLTPGLYRAAIAWLVDGDFTYNYRYIDLDAELIVLDSSNNIVAQSRGVQNWEIVQFTVPTTDIYRFRIERYRHDGATSVVLGLSIQERQGNKAPTVSITSPANGATFTAPASITINATASDSDGSISKVEFYQGSTLVGTDTTSPYSFAWPNVPAGTYSLTAKAYDNLDAVTTSAAVSVTVSSGNRAPTVSITSPANGATFTAPASITINATASDSDGTISKVEFYRGSTLLGTDTSSPYSYAWTNVAAGSYSLTAKAYDNLNAVTTSAAVSVTVSSGNRAPTVSITSPANGATFTAPASITINATASDSDGTISKVEFYRGSTLLGTDTSSPYSYAWTNVAAGTYSLTAKAYDNLSAVTTSAAVSVTVSSGTSRPCTGLCSNPVVFTAANYQSGNLGTGATCHETTANLSGGNCSNIGSRTLKANSSTMSCSNWSLPAKRNGGYCIQVTAGTPNYTAFSTW